MGEIKYRSESEMKDSGFEWIGKFPIHWELKKMRYLASIDTGNKDTQDREENGTYPFYVRSDTVERINSYSYNGEAILTAGDGVGVGRVFHYVDEKFAFHQRVYKLSDFNNILGKYLYYFISENFHKEVMKLSAKSTVDSLRRPMFSNFPVTLPNINEQQKIANFLDIKTTELDQVISKKEKLIEKLEEAKKSLISEVVTGKVKIVDGKLIPRDDSEMKDSGVEWIGEMPKEWNLVRIKRLTNIGRGASPRPIDNPKYFDNKFGEYGWTRIADVTASDKYLFSTKQRMSKLGSSLSVKLNKGDLFLSIAGSVGKPCITGIKACIHDGFVYFPSLDKRLNDFLYYVFHGQQCYKGLGKLGTQLNLNRETVADIQLPMSPNIESQVQISKIIEIKIEQFNKLINKEKKIRDLITQAKQSLISEAVTGKIDLRDWEIIEEGER